MNFEKIKKYKNLIIVGSIVVLLLIVAIIISICIKNNLKQTNSNIKNNFNNNEEILINVNEEVEEFASIEDLEQEADENEEEGITKILIKQITRIAIKIVQYLTI